MSTNRNYIKITNTNANVNIKMVPVNEFQQAHSKQLFVKFVKPTESQHDILQFMDDSTSNYKFSDKSIFLQQIINKKQSKSSDEPEFGKGSSFKRQQKNTRVQADIPTSYTITIDKAKAQKKFKTVPQEMNSNSQYLILVRKSEDLFEAYPIENWYKINPFTKLDISSIEETERELSKKGQNSELSNKKVFEKYKIEEKEQHKNEIVFGNEAEELSDNELQEHEVLKKRKKNGLFQRIRHGQGDVREGESDHDDHQGDEVDYMSDSSLDEDQLSEAEKEKLYETVDVDQEQFLREDVKGLSDQSDDEEKKAQQTEKDNGNVVDLIDDDDEEDDEDDDDDDDDSDDDISDEEISKIKPKIDFNNNLASASLKRPQPHNSSGTDFDAKRRKIANPRTEEILEEIRKHLKRKPLSQRDLHKILLKKKLVENNTESKVLIVECLERLNVKTEVVQNNKVYSL